MGPFISVLLPTVQLYTPVGCPSIMALANSETTPLWGTVSLRRYPYVLCMNAKGPQGGSACLPDVPTVSSTAKLEIVLVLKERN